MAQKMTRLPARFPVGTKYVVEARGSAKGMTLMHRFVEFPDGRRMELAARVVPACVPEGSARRVTRKSAPAARPRRRVTQPSMA
jgi:hypothetical protein